MRGAVAAAALLVAIAAPAAAQDLASRVRGAPDGEVAFRYPLRDDAEVCDHGIRVGERTSRGDFHEGEPERCLRGEAEAVLRVRGGRVVAVDLRPSVPDGARDLGSASGPDAAAFLLSVAREAGSTRAARDALPGAALARDAEAWPALLDIAREGTLAGSVRSAALFWVGQEAGDRVADALGAVATDPDEPDRQVKDAAVFALSRRPADEAIPALMELARTAPDPETRRSAMFWLSRSDDPRVVPFFEAILAGRPN